MKNILLYLIIIFLCFNCEKQEEAIKIPIANEAIKLNEKVDNWQIETFEEQGKYRALPSPENRNKWNDREIAYAGKCLYKVESSYTGLFTFDSEDPTNVYISTDVNPATGEDLGGNREINSAKIGVNDYISTITWKPIT